jgi:hypothetical protein
MGFDGMDFTDMKGWSEKGNEHSSFTKYSGRSRVAAQLAAAEEGIIEWG